MIYLKLFGAILIIFSSVILAENKNDNELNKIKNTYDFYVALRILSADIRIRYTSLSDAFMKISKISKNTKIKNFYKDIYLDINNKSSDEFCEIWNKNINKYSNIFISDLIDDINKIGNTPIYLDSDVQVNYIEEIASHLLEDVLIYKGLAKKRCKINRLLYLFFSVFLVIFLI